MLPLQPSQKLTKEQEKKRDEDILFGEDTTLVCLEPKQRKLAPIPSAKRKLDQNDLSRFKRQALTKKENRTQFDQVLQTLVRIFDDDKAGKISKNTPSQKSGGVQAKLKFVTPE